MQTRYPPERPWEIHNPRRTRDMSDVSCFARHELSAWIGLEVPTPVLMVCSWTGEEGKKKTYLEISNVAMSFFCCMLSAAF